MSVKDGKSVWIVFSHPDEPTVYVKDAVDFYEYVQSHDSPAAHTWKVRVVLESRENLKQVSFRTYFLNNWLEGDEDEF